MYKQSTSSTKSSHFFDYTTVWKWLLLSCDGRFLARIERWSGHAGKHLHELSFNTNRGSSKMQHLQAANHGRILLRLPRAGPTTKRRTKTFRPGRFVDYQCGLKLLLCTNGVAFHEQRGYSAVHAGVLLKVCPCNIVDAVWR